MRFTTIAAIVICAANTNIVIGAEKAKTGGNTPSTITVTGCLEREENEFRLTNTSGAQAPKARSWKSGFLKKGTSNLDLVDASKKIKLKDHVGHRDALTGSLVNGELRVQSVRHLAGSCGR